MKFLSLFAGVGGFDYGLEQAGHECVAQCEINPFCQKILAKHWPKVSRWADVREFQLAEWRRCQAESASGENRRSERRASASSDDDRFSSGSSATSADVAGQSGRECTNGIDLLCGGFPCTDLSIAGKRKGLAGEHSGLFWQIVRIAKEIKSTWGLFENVPGLTSINGGRDFHTVLYALRECWPVVGWRTLDSQFAGVPQRRRRIFFVCGPTEEGVRQVLFESQSSSGHFAPSGKTGQDIAGTLAARSPRFSQPDLDGHGAYVVNDVAKCLATGTNGSRYDYVTEEFIVSPPLRAGCTIPNTGGDEGNIIIQSEVRRLTVIECSRLQGFPDDWLCLCGANENLNACICPDAPRYRALGNAVTIPVIAQLAVRLASVPPFT